MNHTKIALRRELAYWQRGAVGLLALAAAGNTALCALPARQERTIAVDPGVIELGSTVYFEGLDGLVGGYVAEDTDGAIQGNRIDLYVSSHTDALAWGVRDLEVFKIQD